METRNARTEPDCFQGVSSRLSSRPRAKARCSVHQSRRPMMDASPRLGHDRRTRLFIDARLVLRARARATSVRPARSRRRVRVRPRRARTSLARGRTRAGGREPPPVPRSPFVFTVSSVGPSPDDDARFPRAPSSPAAAASRLTRGDALFDGRSRHRARGVRASLALSRRGVSSRRR